MGNNIVYQGVANITDCKFKIDIDRWHKTINE
jgi:hypothetical protein